MTTSDTIGLQFIPAVDVVGPMAGAGAIGAFVTGLDLADPRIQIPVNALLEGLSRHSVLVFRGTLVPPDRFVALGQAFGELEVLPEPDKRHPDHPEIFNLSNLGPDGNTVGFDEPQSVFLRGTERWHTDSSFREIPCLCTMLNALEVPDIGGDTEFADMVGAYEALPPDRRVAVAGADVVHSYEFSRANNPGRLDPMSEEERAKYPPVRHPLVRQLPDGRRALYMGGHASHIVGMGREIGGDGGRALLDELLTYATTNRFLYRHVWQPGDLVIWDNRTALHRLRPYDISNQRRIMQRITVAGREPVMPVSATP